MDGGDGTGSGACLPDHTDNMAASINPPAGLAPSQVPMFVMFGFDDNAYADGMNWVVFNLFYGKRNADGSAARATFFLIGGAATTQNGGVFNAFGGQTEQNLIDSWKGAFDNGHEIGNHTWDHADGGDGRSLADWQPEIGKSNDFIVNTVGIPQCQIVGWSAGAFPISISTTPGFRRSRRRGCATTPASSSATIGGSRRG
jgi:hypothetical protein